MKFGKLAHPNKIKALFIIIITIGYVFGAAILGIYEMGPTQFRRQWIGGTTKNGAPGETVYFNHSVEIRNGRIGLHFEVRDLPNVWGAVALIRRINVIPGESRHLSILVNIPHDVALRDTFEIPFTLITGTYIHGRVKDPFEVPMFLNLRVVEEPTINDDGNNEITHDFWGTIQYLDMEGVLIHLYVMIFAQVFIFYVIPYLKKYKKDRE